MWLGLSEPLFLGAIQMGLVYAFVALGVYISFRVLDFPDLGVDGTFPLGGCVAIMLVLSGGNPWLATLAAAFAGALAGLVTAALNQLGKIPNLLASILTMMGLYSVNIAIMMGAANKTLMPTSPTVLSAFLGGALSDDWTKVLFLLGLVAVIGFLLWWFLVSNIGLAMRATGANPRMARAQGVRTDWQIFLGMALSNALVALGGALYSHINRTADVTLGPGTIVMGLAAVIIGTSILPWRWIWLYLVGCVIGSIIYWLAVAYAMNDLIPGMPPYFLNFAMAVLLAVFLLVARLVGKGAK